MIVRCGACRTQFDVAGAGRFSCPSCGSVNVVRNQAATDPAAASPYPAAPGAPTAPPPPQPDRPSPRISCPDCAFTFIVGNIPVATCPNCGNEVHTGIGTPPPVPEPAVEEYQSSEGDDPVLGEEE